MADGGSADCRDAVAAAFLCRTRRYGVEGVQRGDYDWIQPPSALEPFETFENGLALGRSRCSRCSRLSAAFGLRHRDEVVLVILLVAAPPIVLLAGSYLVTPMLVMRYLIFSFVALYILTSIGIESLPLAHAPGRPRLSRGPSSVLRVVGVETGKDHCWRDAGEIALTRVGSDRRIGAYRGFYGRPPHSGGAARQRADSSNPAHGIEDNGPGVVIDSTPNAGARSDCPGLRSTRW